MGVPTRFGELAVEAKLSRAGVERVASGSPD
jgi:hypothetical protein